MPDPSLQKVQTTPGSNMQKMHKPSGHESNVQKMHIPQEWVEKGARANDPKWGERSQVYKALMRISVRLTLTAVIPLIREDERERLASRIETIKGDALVTDTQTALIADWLRAQGRE